MKTCRLVVLALLAFTALAFPAHAQEAHRFSRLWPTLQQPWYFFRPQGVAVDSEDNFYVADTSNNRVRKFTSDGQYVTQWGGIGNGPGEMDWPTGLAIGPDGRVYVADRFNHRIQRFDQNGRFVSQFATHPLPIALAIDGAGNVYVTFGDNLRVQKYAPEGALLDEFVGDGTADPAIQSCSPEDLIPCEWTPGIAVDPAGRVFVSDVVNYRIVRLDPNLEFEFAFGDAGQPPGTAGNSFGPAFGLATNGVDRLFAADVFNDRIQVFDFEGQFIGLWGASGNAPGELSGPTALTVDRHGIVYTTETGTDRIQKFGGDGVFINQWGSQDVRPGAFAMPADVAVDGGGNVFVADQLNSRIQKFASDGRFLLTWGSDGRGLPDSFVQPRGIAIGTDGNVYIADTRSGDSTTAPRIAVFNAVGEFLREWRIPNIEGDPEIRDEEVFPTGIAVDGENNVYVCQTSYVRFLDPELDNTPIRHRVQKFTDQGDLLAEWGRFGEGDGEFYEPAAVAVDSLGSVYVVESGSVDCTDAPGECPLPNTPPRVQKFTTDGTFILSWGGFGDAAGRFNEPRGIAIDAEDRVYVSDSRHNRVQVFTTEGGYLAEFGELGDSPGQLLLPEGLDFAPDGSLYLADARHNRIQQFRPAAADGLAKAVIVAGGGDGADNPLWPVTQMCVNVAYRSLTHQGFTKESIRYLSSDTSFDFDSNLATDDIVPATAAELEDTLTSWASDANRVVVYMTGVGSSDRFRVNNTEFVGADDLDAWLDALEASIPGPLLLVYDAASSGSILDNLAEPRNLRRAIVTSTAADEPAYFVTKGTLSFSYQFWVAVLNGLDAGDAFAQARDALGEASGAGYQHPQLDSDGDGIGNGAGDTIGFGFFEANPSFDTPPVVGSVTPEQNLPAQETAATFFARDVTDDQAAIARVWAIVTPPMVYQPPGRPVDDLPTFELGPGSGEFTGTFAGFDQPGEYTVDIYAMDGNLNVAVVAQTIVSNAILAASLFCVVVDADTDEPILNATVSLAPSAASPITGSRDGVYNFAGLPDGTYTLTASAPNFTDHLETVTLTAGQLESLTIALGAATIGGKGGSACYAGGGSAVGSEIGNALISLALAVGLCLAEALRTRRS